METVLRRKLKRHGYELSGEGTRPTPALLRRYAQASFERRSADAQALVDGEPPGPGQPSDHVAARLTSRQIELAAAKSSS